MTSEPESGPEPGSERRPRRRWRLGTPTVMALCGVLVAVSYHSSEGTDLRPGRYNDMASLAQAESEQYEQVREQIADLEAENERLSNLVNDRRVRELRQEVERFSAPAGLEPVAGPGVTVELSDAPPEKVDAAEEQGVNLNDLVVHQQDIQRVVNAMWRAGAEAVTVNGQRIITSTGIKCEGNAVTLHGIPYPQPYVIQAVGDPQRILTHIDTDQRLTAYREQAADPTIAIGWRLDVETWFEAPGYDGLLDVRYAEPLGG